SQAASILAAGRPSQRFEKILGNLRYPAPPKCFVCEQLEFAVRRADAPRGTGGDPSFMKPPGQAGGVRACDAKNCDIGRSGRPQDLAVGPLAQGLEQALGCRRGTLKPLVEPVEMVQRNRRVGPGLAKAAAEHPALMVQRAQK